MFAVFFPHRPFFFLAYNVRQSWQLRFSSFANKSPGTWADSNQLAYKSAMLGSERRKSRQNTRIWPQIAVGFRLKIRIWLKTRIWGLGRSVGFFLLSVVQKLCRIIPLHVGLVTFRIHSLFLAVSLVYLRFISVFVGLLISFRRIIR